MIKLFGRMIPAAARGLHGGMIAPTTPLATRFRVLPHDIDLNRHLNNGRYLQIMDLNRLEWLLRARVLQVLVQQGWKPILGSTAIQFRRELKLWQTGIASTTLAGFDDRWVYLEHRIDTADGKPVAMGLARAGFRHRGGWVSVDRLRALLPIAVPDMALPDHVTAWQALDDEFGRRLVGEQRIGRAAIPSQSVSTFAKVPPIPTGLSAQGSDLVCARAVPPMPEPRYERQQLG